MMHRQGACSVTSNLGRLASEISCITQQGILLLLLPRRTFEQKVIAFRREAEAVGMKPEEKIVVFLNFSGQTAQVWLPFSRGWELG